MVSSVFLLTTDAAAAPDMDMLSEPIQINANVSGVVGYCVYQLADGSLIVNSANQTCTFLTKLDPTNQLAWTKTFQISKNDTALTHLVPVSDGGFMLAGLVNNQYVLVKTDSQGNTQWTETLNSGVPVNYFMAITEANDGGFAVAGFGEPAEDSLGWIWLAKTDSQGSLQWSKNISGPRADCPSSITQTSDGTYLLSDTSYSFVPDQAFFCLIKLTANGEVISNSTYGGEGYYYQPECNFLENVSDGGYLLGGYLWRKPAWVVKADVDGVMQWNKTYGEAGCSIVDALQTPQGYLFLEYLKQNCTGIILTDGLGNPVWNTTYSEVTVPVGLEANFNTIISAKDGGYIMVASKDQSVWLTKLSYPKEELAIAPLLGIAGLVFATALAATFVVWHSKAAKRGL